MIIDAAELRRRRLQRLKGVRDKKVYIGPAIVSLEIIEKCNLKCRYCWVHSPGHAANIDGIQSLSWARFGRIVRDCVDLKVEQIHILGKGEPTLHPLFRKMMRHLEKQPLTTRLYTNAAFPMDYCSDVIRGDQVIINLSAADRQQYRRIHGADLFGRVVNNIKRLVALRDAKKLGFRIGISYIVNSLNIGKTKEMEKLASRLGVGSVFFKKMVLDSYNREIAVSETSKSKVARAPRGCSNGWFNLFLTLDGHSSICCLIRQMPYCDVGKKSLKDLWFSPPMMYARLMSKNGHIQKIFKACQFCARYEAEHGKTIFPDDQYTYL